MFVNPSATNCLGGAVSVLILGSDHCMICKNLFRNMGVFYV